MPSKNIQSTCLAYSDAGIQQILDVGYFTEQFDFDAAAAQESTPAPAAGSGETTGSSSDAMAMSMVWGFASVVVLAVFSL